jgi:hypothetical protein
MFVVADRHQRPDLDGRVEGLRLPFSPEPQNPEAQTPTADPTPNLGGKQVEVVLVHVRPIPRRPRDWQLPRLAERADDASFDERITCGVVLCHEAGHHEMPPAESSWQ